MRNTILPTVCVTLALSLGASSLLAQDARAELGLPFLRSYDYRDYGAHPQNWAIAQDPRGVMYFGNTEGVLEYDGVGWRLVPVSNASIVRSLAVDRQGTVYVGGVGEIGYLRPDARGELTYGSLLDALPLEERGFADVWRTFATGDGVFYWTRYKLFRWRRGQFHVWELDTFLVPFVLDGRLYYNRRHTGLMVLKGDAFEPVAGGEALARIRFDLVLPAEDGAVLVGQRDGRLYHLALPGSTAEGGGEPGGARVVRFETAADAFLETHSLYSGAHLPGGGYALGTMTGGVVVLGGQGEILGAPSDSPTGRRAGSWPVGVCRSYHRR